MAYLLGDAPAIKTPRDFPEIIEDGEAGDQSHGRQDYGHAEQWVRNQPVETVVAQVDRALARQVAALGVDGGRVTIISYGEERPLCTERTETCWAKNRRAHFLVKQ